MPIPINGKLTCATCGEIKDKLLFQKIDHKYYTKNCKDCDAKRRRHDSRIVRSIVLKHYGGNPPRCACCGETIEEFLTVHHIDGNGRAHRIEINVMSGTSFYSWLLKNKFPLGFSVLCQNCNWAMGNNKNICPHQKGKL